jgi:hypothetical protein
MSVGSRRMFMSEFAMFVSRSCVVRGFLVLVDRVMVLGLMMVMRSGMVVGGSQVMMLLRRMLRRLRHLQVLPFCECTDRTETA